MKTRYAKRRKKLKIMVFIVLVSIGILFALFVKKNKNEHEGINMAQACKVIAYACGYQPLDGHGNYWYDEYIDYVREKQIFTDFKAKDAFTRKYAKELFLYCGVNFAEELYSYDTFSNEQFSQLIYELKDFFSSGDNLSWMEAAVVATPDMDSQLSGWSVCTDKGIYSFKGLKLSGKVDKNCEFLTCGSEILMFVKETGSEVTYKNVWIYKIENNKMYIDLYGIKRKFQVGNIENTGSVMADVSLENKKIDAINLKKDTISGKVLSVSDEYIEITGYGKVFVDNNFVRYNLTDYSADRDVNNIVIGYDLQDFIVAGGKICGAFLSKGFSPGNIRVLLKTTGYADIFHNKVSVTSDNGYKVCFDEKEIHVDAGNISEFDISDSKFDNGRIEIKPDTADGKIKVTNISRSQGNPEYYGIIELSLWDEGIVIINETDIEQYLKTVVPSEMPVSFGVEALKVQAVCARSYAYKHLTNVGYALYGAHVDDSTQFQVYNNNLEFDASNQAILATKGEMLRYGDDVVQAYYYSTSCGSGTDVTLWGSSKESYPYYESRDIGSSERNINYMDEESFASFIKQKYDSDYDSTCNYYRWKMTVSDKDLSSSFDSKISDVGIIQNIYVRKRVSGGAAVSVVVEGDKNTVTLGSESLIRQAFGNAAVTLETNGGTVNTPYLPSTFCIFESQEKDGEKYFVITGGGFGHGIGMSQNAVNAMTKRGMSYKDILEFFYPGTKVA